MAPVTVFGATADPDVLREVAALHDQPLVFRARVEALPSCVLTDRSKRLPPPELAQRLIEIARFLERRRAGIPWGKGIPQ